MNPLDAVSVLTEAQAPTIPTAGINFQQTGPTVPGPTISEGFQNQLQLMNISQITAPAVSAGSGAGPSTWGHLVQQMVLDVNSKQETAAQKVSDVLQGGPTPVHEAMVASQEASLSFEFLGEMRNKIVDAYQQVMQMQV